jgi:pullulanase/glycogen debranching enzyme
LRKEHPLLNRTHYQHGHTVSKQTGLPDISWLNCRGQLMQTSDWHDSSIKCVSMLLADTKSEVLPAVETIFGEYCPLGQLEDDALLIIFNAHQSDIHYALPKLNGYWQVLLNTAEPINICNENTNRNTSKNITKTSITATAHSCVVLSFSRSKQENKIRINQLTSVSKENRE